MSQWISVTERMPEKHVEVIVYAPAEKVRIFTAAYWQGAHAYWHRSRCGDYAPLDDFYGDDPFDVTHWTPLPDPPTE